MSQFIYLYRTSDAAQQESMGTPERAQQNMQRWMSWLKELDAKGHLKNYGQPLERTGRVIRGKNKLITDGPYAEGKEYLGGLCLITAADLDEALEWGRKSTPPREGLSQPTD